MPRRCFVPGCKTGHRKTYDPTLTLFKAPSNDTKLKVWDRTISRADRKLHATDYVCELHFEEHMILRYYTHVVRGETIKIPRGKVTLIETAVPNCFPNFPSHLSLHKTCKRTLGKNVTDAAKTNDVWQWLLSRNLDNGWSRRISIQKTLVTYFYCHETEKAQLLIKVVWHCDSNLPCVYICNHKINFKLLNFSKTYSAEDILLLFRKLEVMEFCKRIATEELLRNSPKVPLKALRN